ncbi:MAG: hypothetical protein K6T91_09820 [Firmicutes bacterium]|nr:hypothetical protein [Bacillota bacterium]
MGQKTKGGKTLIESIIELIDLIALYARKQIQSVVDRSITGPISKAAQKAGFFILAFSLFSLAVVFIAVGLFLFLASLTGYIIAYLIIGLLLVIVGLLFLRQAK